MTTIAKQQAAPFVGAFDDSMLHDMQEFSKRYTDTYIFCAPSEGEKAHLYNVREIFEGKVHLFNLDYGEIILSEYSNAVLEVRWPKRGLFNTKDNFGFVYRIPDRQWKRAPCNKNVHFSFPMDEVLAKRLVSHNWSTSIYQAYSTDTYTIKQAISLLEVHTTRVGLALNREWAVSLPTNNKENLYILWYGQVPVGEIYPKGNVIKMKYSHVTQELSDYLRDTEQSWKIS